MATVGLQVSQKLVDGIKLRMERLYKSSHPKSNLQVFVDLHCRDISAGLGKGYSYAEIANSFGKEGVKISTATLSNYHRKSVAKGLNERSKGVTVKKIQPILKKSTKL